MVMMMGFYCDHQQVLFSCLGFFIRTMHNMRCLTHLYKWDCLSDLPAPPTILSPTREAR